eukprot:15058-Heterococcus_DN1.PRE.2
MSCLACCSSILQQFNHHKDPICITAAVVVASASRILFLLSLLLLLVLDGLTAADDSTAICQLHCVTVNLKYTGIYTAVPVRISTIHMRASKKQQLCREKHIP